MKQKEGRDFLAFNDCMVSIKEIDDKEYITIFNICECFKLSFEEFDTMIKFYNKHKDKK